MEWAWLFIGLAAALAFSGLAAFGNLVYRMFYP